MALCIETLADALQKQKPSSVLFELVLFSVPLWISLIAGLFLGWVWKPRWVSWGREIDLSSKYLPLPLMGRDKFGLFSVRLGSIFSMDSLKMQLPSCISSPHLGTCSNNDSFSSFPMETNEEVLSQEDLDHFCKLVEVKDGGPPWIPMMDRSTEKMSYQAWRRDPMTGPPQYRSRTVLEDVTPEIVRDFFWDDEFRPRWDDMLIHSSILQECPSTGQMVVHWIRKFPFFCSDREYIIGRRIWESGRSYYCVTKGVPSTALPRQEKPRRVDVYYSSWLIQAVKSRRDSQMTACEVLLFHHEDMGIPWEIAKLGVRQGMWKAVKKIEPGLRAYQLDRQSGVALSKCAQLAQTSTKLTIDYFDNLKAPDNSIEVDESKTLEKNWGKQVSRIAIVGGAMVLACSLDRGLLVKAVIFGVARGLGKLRGRV